MGGLGPFQPLHEIQKVRMIRALSLPNHLRPPEKEVGTGFVAAGEDG